MLTNMWVKLYETAQPSETELTALLQQLLTVCDEFLLADLIHIVYDYLTSNFEQLRLGMYINVHCDTLVTEPSQFKGWAIAQIVQLVHTPVSSECVCVKFIEKQEWISVDISRIRLLRNKYGQVYFFNPLFRNNQAELLVHVNKSIDVDYHEHCSGRWYKAKLGKIALFCIEVPDLHEYIVLRNIQGSVIAPAGTFT